MALTQIEPYMVDTTATFSFANTTIGNVTATTVTSSGSVSATTAVTVTASAQPNITSVGTLANLTVSGTTSYGLSADNLVLKTGATGTVTHDVSTGALFYHTSPAANFVVNLTNVPTSDGKVYMVTLLISQGATPYIPSALWIDSYVQTIKWIAGISALGNASKTDVISYSLMRTGGSWTVFGQSSYYG
jgi:hypothetical protein